MANELVEGWLALDDAKRREELECLKHPQRRYVKRKWRHWAHPGQLPPEGPWQTWLIMAGRGYGKTRAGAEWVREVAEANPAARIALVGDSLGEVRRVMIEGESGLLAVARPNGRPLFEPSKRQLSWANGAQATMYSAGEPESLRGPQHSHAWCDEIAKWSHRQGRAEAAWNNLLLGLRLGSHPQVVATTTPRPVPLLRALLDQPDVTVTRGTTADNKGNLAPGFFRRIRVQFGRRPARRRRSSSSMRRTLCSMRCFIRPWKARRTIRRPPRLKAKPGSSAPLRPARGRSMPEAWPRFRRGLGCSPQRAMACEFSTARQGRTCVTTADGSAPPPRRTRRAVPLSTARRGRQLSD